jgi:outer membrane immunogenic protein
MRSVLVALTTVATLALATATPASAEGFRAEIHGGWDHPSVGHSDDDGIVYGVGLGYDLNIGSKAFIGADLSLDDSSSRDCDHSVFAANDRLCVNAGRDIAAGVRLGVNLTPKDKIYALGAYTNARIKARYTTAGGVTTHDADNLDGFRLGAGYERMLGSNTYAKLEYRYSNYEQNVDRHQLLVGVGLTF